MKMLLDDSSIEIDALNSPLLRSKNISLSIARLDKIHPIISGNKLFKLHYFLEASLSQQNRPILTFGGAWSNHLVATAYACRLSGIPCIGVVRGEQPTEFSQTLQACESYGMQLHFISRENYAEKTNPAFIEQFKQQFGTFILVPEGGYHPLGAAGAALIMNKLTHLKATHVCTAVGTATTLAGLLQNCRNNENIMAVPVLKNMTDITERLLVLGCLHPEKNLTILDGYHFGGYAKYTTTLIHFMNQLFTDHAIPTDFVYTAKMLFAIMDKIKSGYFKEGSNIVCLHTGGLQGNSSLAAGTLVF